MLKKYGTFSSMVAMGWKSGVGEDDADDRLEEEEEEERGLDSASSTHNHELALRSLSPNGNHVNNVVRSTSVTLEVLNGSDAVSAADLFGETDGKWKHHDEGTIVIIVIIIKVIVKVIIIIIIIIIIIQK